MDRRARPPGKFTSLPMSDQPFWPASGTMNAAPSRRRVVIAVSTPVRCCSQKDMTVVMSSRRGEAGHNGRFRVAGHPRSRKRRLAPGRALGDRRPTSCCVRGGGDAHRGPGASYRGFSQVPRVPTSPETRFAAASGDPAQVGIRTQSCTEGRGAGDPDRVELAVADNPPLRACVRGHHRPLVCVRVVGATGRMLVLSVDLRLSFP